MPNLRQQLKVDAHQYVDQQETGPHTHHRHQLTYARSGVLTIDIDAARWVVPPLRAVWIPAGIRHSVQAHGSTSARLAFVDPTASATLPSEVTVIRVSPLFRAVLEELRHDRVGDEQARPHLEALFTLQVQQHVELSNHSSRPLQIPAMTDPRLITIEQALRRAPSDRRTLREWGGFCGSSERSLSRLFAQETGTTFSQWRNQLRLQHALVRLADGTSVTETAHDCGYHSTSAFIESFRSALGTTPGKFFALDEALHPVPQEPSTTNA